MTNRPIIIVEENADDLYLLTRRIKTVAAQNPILNFFDPKDAIEYLERLLLTADDPALPCVLFTDVHLLGGDGFQVMEWVRQQPRLSTLKMFVISGSEDPKHRARARDLGASGFVLKMPTAEALKGMLAGVCVPQNGGEETKP